MKRVPKDVQEKLDALQRLLDDVTDALTEAADTAEAYYEDRTDAWRESDRGEAYCEWAGFLKEIAEMMEELRDKIQEFPMEPEAS